MTLADWLAERERLAKLATPYVPGRVTIARGAEGYRLNTDRGMLCDGMVGTDAFALANLLDEARESLPRLVEMVRVLSEALVGDTDLDNDESEEMAAMQQASKALARVEAMVAPEREA